ncbi:hypothetical protein GCM10023201_32250 [Actinomycetospora corticicola]|uniref:PASTA domain-containing protein n=1 Tax=Actinomycetospora corticicola TaxID=663602 RepID=A0A7Y9DUL1_9PSEU|nr:PASTA domain-containing protein [Actinomycetospora corticicola]NYD35745.1 hypothetical protein [Actinomycetospora corticicola]
MDEQPQTGRASWKDLRPRTQLGIIFAIVTALVVGLSINSAAARADRAAATPVAGSSSLPMTPTGSYTVGQQYYADKIAMPNYVGWTLQAAVNDLASRGIRVGGFAPSYANSVIAYQNPYPGTRVGQSTVHSIQLMVSNAAPTTTPPTASTTTTPPSNTDVDIDVDEDHNLPDGALTGGFCRRKWWC